MMFWWIDLWIKFWFTGFDKRDPEPKAQVFYFDDEVQRRRKTWV